MNYMFAPKNANKGTTNIVATIEESKPTLGLRYAPTEYEAWKEECLDILQENYDKGIHCFICVKTFRLLLRNVLLDNLLIVRHFLKIACILLR